MPAGISDRDGKLWIVGIGPTMLREIPRPFFAPFAAPSFGRAEQDGKHEA
jgi:hypothetical protein